MDSGSPAGPSAVRKAEAFHPVRVVWAPAALLGERSRGRRAREVPCPPLPCGARIRRWRHAEPLSGPLGAVFFGRRSDGRAPGEGPGSAVRVQSLDGSQHSAFRVTYRTSLRPSSSGDPRCPSSRVVFTTFSRASASHRGGAGVLFDFIVTEDPSETSGETRRSRPPRAS